MNYAESLNELLVAGVIGGGLFTLWLIARWSAGRQVARVDEHDKELKLIKKEQAQDRERQAQDRERISVLEATVVNQEKLQAEIEKVNQNVDNTRVEMREEFKEEHKHTRDYVKKAIDDRIKKEEADEKARMAALVKLLENSTASIREDINNLYRKNNGVA